MQVGKHEPLIGGVIVAGWQLIQLGLEEVSFLAEERVLEPTTKDTRNAQRDRRRWLTPTRFNRTQRLAADPRRLRKRNL